MKIEIDQSGRVEYTSHNTVVADSQGCAVSINAAEKRKVQTYFRELGRSSQFTISTFAALVALLISTNKEKGGVYVIDEEYVGHSNKIKGLICEYCRSLGIPVESSAIQFGHVGKHSLAHKNGLATFRGEQGSSKYVVTAGVLKRILRLHPIKKT